MGKSFAFVDVIYVRFVCASQFTAGIRSWATRIFFQQLRFYPDCTGRCIGWLSFAGRPLMERALTPFRSLIRTINVTELSPFGVCVCVREQRSSHESVTEIWLLSEPCWKFRSWVFVTRAMPTNAICVCVNEMHAWARSFCKALAPVPKSRPNTFRISERNWRNKPRLRPNELRIRLYYCSTRGERTFWLPPPLSPLSPPHSQRTQAHNKWK